MTECSICSGSLSSSGRDLMWPRRVGGLPRVGDYPARPTGAIDVSNPGQACDLLDSGTGHAVFGGGRCFVPWARGAARERGACWPLGVAVLRWGGAVCGVLVLHGRSSYPSLLSCSPACTTSAHHGKW